MKFHLPLSKIQSDFYGELIETVTHYYPIGIKSSADSYHTFSGQVALSEIVIDNIHKVKNYKSRWKEFENKLKFALNKKIWGETYATKPSFSASVIIKKSKHHDLIHIKKLHFSVSLLGPYYTIYGIDETAIVDEKDGRDLYYSAINTVTVSPYKEYESSFISLRELIEKQFTDYKFIPFKLHSKSIEGLFDPYHNDEEMTIYGALFDDFLQGYNLYKTRGDSQYGTDVWVKY
jgi:hypothetical protein